MKLWNMINLCTSMELKVIVFIYLQKKKIEKWIKNKQI